MRLDIPETVIVILAVLALLTWAWDKAASRKQQGGVSSQKPLPRGRGSATL